VGEWVPVWVQWLAGVSALIAGLVWFFVAGVSWLAALHTVSAMKAEAWVTRVRSENGPDVCKLRARVSELEAERDALERQNADLHNRIAEMGGHRG